MRLVLQALRAATIETLGVAFVVFLLFGIPAWSLQQVAEPTVNSKLDWSWAKSLHQGFKDSVSALRPDEDRQEYTAQQLTYYGQLYRRAAGEYAHDVVHHVLADRPEVTTRRANGALGRSLDTM
jgi:hypothetical protein